MDDRTGRHERQEETLSPAKGIRGLLKRRDFFDRIISLVFLLCLLVVFVPVFYKKFNFAPHELTGNNVTGQLQHMMVNIKDANGNYVVKDNEAVEGAIFTYGADYELTLSWELQQTGAEEQALGKGDYLLLTLGDGFFDYQNTRLDHALMYRENQIGEWGIKNNKLQNIFRDTVKQFSKTEGSFDAKGTFCSKAVGIQAVTIAGVEIQNVICNPKEESFPAEKYVRVRYDSPIVTSGEVDEDASAIRWEVLVNAKYEADHYYAKMRKELLMGDASLESVLLKEPLPEDLVIDTVDIQTRIYRPRSMRELSGVVTAKFSLTGQFHKVDQKTGQPEEDWLNELKTYGRAYGISVDKKTLYVWVENISDLKLAADSEDFEDKLILGTIHRLTTAERQALADIYGENGAYPAEGFVVALVSKPAGGTFEKESYKNTVYLKEKDRETGYDSKPVETGKLMGGTGASVPHEARLVIRDYHTQEPVAGAEVKLQYALEDGEWHDYAKDGAVVIKTTDTEGVLLFDDLKPAVYRFVEIKAGEGYDVASAVYSEEQFVIGTETQTREISATNEVLGRNITVRQVWEDYHNEAGVRPAAVELTLRADGEEYRTAFVTAEQAVVAADGVAEENIWEYTFTDLPVYGSGTTGEIIDYTVQAELPEGYEQVVEGYTITNTLHLLHSVRLVKRDYNTREPICGAVFRLQMLREDEWVDCPADGSAAKNNAAKATVFEKMTDERGEVTFTDLEAGCYRFVEVSARAGYDLSSAAYSVNPFVIYPTDVKEVVISATNRISNMDILVTKVWRDSNNIAGVRPGFVTLILMDGASEVRREILSAKNATSNPNIWEVLFKDLPVYFGDTSRRIDYTVREEAVAHYNTTIEGYTVTDTLSLNHAAGLTVTDRDTGAVLEGVGFKLQYQGADGWEDYREKGVAAVKMTDSEGNLMFSELPYGRYRFVEVSARTGYNIVTVEYSEKSFVISETDSIQIADKSAKNDDNLSFRQINVTNEVFKTDVTVRKVWEDYDNLYGVRPEAVTIHLMKGTNETGAAVLTEADAVTDEDGTRQLHIWEHTFENVPQYDGKTGEKIQYSVRENKVDKYTQKTDGFTVTGSLDFVHTVQLTCADAATGERLSGICFKLQYRDKNRWLDHQEDGSTAMKQTLADGTLEFDRLPAGQYRFVEVETKESYDLNSAQYSENEFTLTSADTQRREIYVTNSLRDTSITVKKVWKDYRNAAGVRPQAVTISLKEGGRTVRTAVLTGENALQRPDGTTDDSVWTYTFEALAPADEQTQKALLYTVEEETIDNYFQSVNGYVITDTLQLAHAVIVRKSDYNTGAPVDGSVFKLQYLNETEWEDYTVNGSALKETTDENGALVFQGLTEGTYRVVEMLAKEGYSIESAVYSENSFVILPTDTFTREILVTNRVNNQNITVRKVWEDDSNAAGLRPASVTIRLMSGSNEIRCTTLTGANALHLEDGTLSTNEWEYTFVNLPVYDGDSDRVFVYTVTEDRVEHYERKIRGYEIHNTLHPVHSVQLSLTEQSSGSVIEGAKFKLQYLSGGKWQDYKEEGIAVVKLTDEEGMLTFYDIPENSYRIVELVAPLGYDAGTAQYSVSRFDIQTEDTGAKQIRVTNRREENSGSQVVADLRPSENGSDQEPDHHEDSHDEKRTEDVESTDGGTGKEPDNIGEERETGNEEHVAEQAGSTGESTETSMQDHAQEVTAETELSRNLTLGTGIDLQNSEGYLSYEEYLNRLSKDPVEYNGGSRLVSVISKEQPSYREPVKKKNAKADKITGVVLIVLAAVFGFEVVYGIIKGKDE